MRMGMFFDRDGVVNALVTTGHPHGRSPRTLSEFKILPGVKEGFREADEAGFIPIIITNQPDVERGNVGRGMLGEMHAKLSRDLPQLKAIYVCEHGKDHCSCRKPKPGLLFQAAMDHGIDLMQSWMIGDRWVDIAAGASAGCRTVLVAAPYSWIPSSSGIPESSLR